MRARGATLPFLFVTLAAGAGATGEAPLIAVEGDGGAWSCGAAPPGGWQQPGFDDRDWTRGPAGAVTADCGVLRLRRRFTVDDPARLVSLALNVRYQDGFVAWINGQQVARRRYEEGPLATEPHGPEPERVPVLVTPGLLRPGVNLVAVEAHPHRAGRAPAAEVTLDPSSRVRIARGPYLTRVLDGAAHYVVETDVPTRADLRAHSPAAPGGRAQPERRAVHEIPSTRHELRLDGLLPGRVYAWRLTLAAPAGTAAEVEGALHTPPTADHRLRFVVTGDMRSGHDVHAGIVRAILAEDPDFVLMTGDLVAIGSEEAEWQRFFEIEAPLLARLPVYSAVGNHDYWRGTEGLKRFLAAFGRPGGTGWWSFDVAGAHFVLLDSQAYRDPAQLAWLRQDLSAARKRGARAIFACTHHGAWSSGMHGDNPTAIAEYVPLLAAARTTALIAGHDHHYERGRVGSLNYVVSGGGGAELRTARCGVPGKRRCPPHVAAFVNEHHYVVFELTGTSVRLCPKRVDGTLLEPCTTLPR